MHLLWRSFEKLSATADKKGITCKDCFLFSILHEEAHAVLCVTWGWNSSHSDSVADFELFAVFDLVIDCFAFSTVNCQRGISVQYFLIAACMIPITMRRQIDTTAYQ